MSYKRNNGSIEINAKVIYERVTSCWADPSVNASVPLLKEAANVTLAILYSVKAVKRNKNAFHRLAYHAADLIVVIWRSYSRSKVPEDWLSPQLRDILQELLEKLNSILEFVNEVVSMNSILRMMSSANNLHNIQKYHEQLKTAIDKFEVQSHINASHLLAQILKKQERLSDQIIHRKNTKNIVSKGNAGEGSIEDKPHDHETTPNRQNYSIDVVREGAIARVSLEISTGLPVEGMARSEKAKITREVEANTRESNHWTEDPDAQPKGFSSESENLSDKEDDEIFPTINIRTKGRRFSSNSILSSPTTEAMGESDRWTEDRDTHLEDSSEDENLSDEEADEVPPTINPSKTKARRSSSNSILSSSTTSNRPMATHENHATQSLFSFTNSGGGVMVNQGVGNVTYTNVSKCW